MRSPRGPSCVRCIILMLSGLVELLFFLFLIASWTCDLVFLFFQCMYVVLSLLMFLSTTLFVLLVVCLMVLFVECVCYLLMCGGCFVAEGDSLARFFIS